MADTKRFHLVSTALSILYKHRLALLVTALFVTPLAKLPASEVQLGITASGGFWEAFAQITDATSVDAASISGCGVNGVDCPITSIAGFQIDVVGSGGLTVTSSANESPQNVGAGFSTLRMNHNGTPGLGIAAAQPTFLGMPTMILEGIGLVPQNTGTVLWDVPVKLATGTYSGTNGTLTISDVDPIGGINGINLTFGLNGTWTGAVSGSIGNDVEAASVVSRATVTVPEPSTGVMLFVGQLVIGWAVKRLRLL